MGKHEPSKEIFLTIDNHEIEVNKFVGKFLKGAIKGILKSLKDIPKDFTKIEIIIYEGKER